MASQRDSAREALETFVFLEADAPALQKALAAEEGAFSLEVQGRLLNRWSPFARPTDFPFLENLHARWEGQVDLQKSTLAIVAGLDTPEARSFMQARLPEVDSPGPAWIEDVGAALATHAIDAPLLLEWWNWVDSVPDFQAPIWGWSRQLLEDSLPANTLNAGLPGLMDQYPRLIAERESLAPNSAAAQQTDERIFALLTLLKAFADEPSVNNALQAASHTGPISSQIQALRASFSTHFPVADTTLERLAARPLARKSLLLALQESGQSQRFPQRWKTRAALAEADLASWILAQGWLPDRMRLIDSVKIGEESASAWMYRFQYRARGTRYQGFSGPQPLDDPEGTLTGVYTGSPFEPFRRAKASEVQRWLERIDAPERVIE